MKKIIIFITLTLAFSIVSFAQTRQPSEPVRPYVVKTDQDVTDLEKSLHDDKKAAELISEGMQTRVAIQHDEKKTPPARKFTTLPTMYITFSTVRRNQRSAANWKIRKRRLPANGNPTKSSAAKLLQSKKAIWWSFRAALRISASTRKAKPFRWF